MRKLFYKLEIRRGSLEWVAREWLDVVGMVGLLLAGSALLYVALLVFGD